MPRDIFPNGHPSLRIVPGPSRRSPTETTADNPTLMSDARHNHCDIVPSSVLKEYTL